MKELHDRIKETGQLPENILEELDAEVSGVDDSIDVEAEKRSLYKRLGKRAITGSDRSRWPQGIVPYMYTDQTDAEDQHSIRRAQLMFERFTCIRFVPWVSSATNEDLGLGHPSYLKYIVGGSCFSYLGNLRSENGQAISCCHGTTCVHEIGHAMGLHHEQSTPDEASRWMIRFNYENITPDGLSQYRLADPRTDKAINGYDIGSRMHYADWGFSNGGKTFTKLFPELKTRNTYHYMMEEVSRAHECGALHCADSTLDCQNDGYLTTVDYQCACKCVPGLDAGDECRTTISSDTTTQGFPGGSYALPETNEGCPLDSMTSGSRQHFTTYVTTSNRYDLKGEMIASSSITGSEINHNFCVSENSAGDAIWPAGSYCIYRKGGSCPDNFKEGFIQYDDKRDRDNSVDGNLPDGVFDDNTRFEYCCRDDGFTSEPIFLPHRDAFALFKNEDDCQQVQGMHAYSEYYEIHNTYEEEIMAFGGEDNPISENALNRYKTEICYYKPAMLDCGGVIELTENSPTATFTTPSDNELECTWYLKTQEDAQIILNFDSFNVSCDSGDKLAMQYFRPGQKAFPFCGTSFDRTIRSVNKTIRVQFSTFGESSSAFSASASLAFDRDLSYSTADRGVSYVGEVSFTRFFEPCLPWTEVTNCRYNAFKTSTSKVHTTLLDGNYCRNPDYNTGIMPWCYITADTCDRNYCDVSLLGEEYDSSDNCEALAEGGICSTDAAMQLCAKTCGIGEQAPTTRVADVLCATPPDVADGTALITEGMGPYYAVGQTVTYTCNDTPATSERICLSTGEWSEMGFSCDNCLPGWLLDWENRVCLKSYMTATTLTNARGTCEEFGGTLAAPKNSAMNTAIKSLITMNTWLPLNDISDEGQFVWEDGSSLSWTNWHRGQPNNRGNREDCAVMYTSGRWGDSNCAYDYSFVCQLPLLSTSTCQDFTSRCRSLFELNPAMCVNDEQFAHRICPYTCGLCGESTTTCTVENSAVNGYIVTDADEVSMGETVETACNDGFVHAYGQAVRGCLDDGTLGGEPMICIAGCPEGWTYMESTMTCYKYFNNMVDYETASTNCQDEGGFLAMPKSSAETDKIKAVVSPSTDIWIGLDDRETEDVFQWINGDPLFGYENWYWYQPNDSGYYGQDCVRSMSNGRWRDERCTKEYAYVCQLSVTSNEQRCDLPALNSNVIPSLSVDSIIAGQTIEYSCENGFAQGEGDTSRTCLDSGELSGESLTCVNLGCPESWVFSEASGTCYKFFSQKKRYEDAIEECNEVGGTLPMPKNEAESDIMRSAITSDNWVWLGMNDMEQEGTMVWDDGTPLTWTNWRSGQPDDWRDNEDCVRAKQSGEWNDVKCSSRTYYVCAVPFTEFH